MYILHYVLELVTSQLVHSAQLGTKVCEMFASQALGIVFACKPGFRNSFCMRARL